MSRWPVEHFWPFRDPRKQTLSARVKLPLTTCFRISRSNLREGRYSAILLFEDRSKATCLLRFREHVRLEIPKKEGGEKEKEGGGEEGYCSPSPSHVRQGSTPRCIKVSVMTQPPSQPSIRQHCWEYLDKIGKVGILG
ncbi:hypothetical protein BKA70DRAFT_1401097 [Coprinopsis sp. MPI-PUGE-AT-0042]|nr:hypothetical protein BKA70DRAFT_1401097 [Coprinopsis sp. MPI-PUGE-AT-0042]